MSPNQCEVTGVGHLPVRSRNVSPSTRENGARPVHLWRQDSAPGAPPPELRCSGPSAVSLHLPPLPASRQRRYFLIVPVLAAEPSRLRRRPGSRPCMAELSEASLCSPAAPSPASPSSPPSSYPPCMSLSTEFRPCRPGNISSACRVAPLRCLTRRSSSASSLNRRRTSLGEPLILLRHCMRASPTEPRSLRRILQRRPPSSSSFDHRRYERH
ncbi:uncharacterized protein [Lolium perenne]|uniref:uncharacterized protein n=1 Tax=Lolium perenne TaxID=4522 RepID=UPI003A996346